MYYNPSFAGSGQSARVSYVSRIVSYNRMKSVYSYNNLSADTYIPEIATGIGIKVDATTSRYEKNSFQPTFRYNTYSAGIAFAPKISIKGLYTISPAIELDYYRENDLKPDSSFKDLKNKTFGFIGLTGSILFNSKKLYAGLTFNTFSRHSLGTQAKSYYRFSGSKIPLWFVTAQVGFTIHKNDKSNFSITPQGIFDFTGDDILFGIRQIDINFRFRKILFGPTMNQLDGIGFMLGRQSDSFKIIFVNCIGFLFEVAHKNGLSYRGMIGVRYFLNKKNNPRKNQF
jgi:hypothetical protein